jgi:hypothetical protein
MPPIRHRQRGMARPPVPKPPATTNPLQGVTTARFCGGRYGLGGGVLLFIHSRLGPSYFFISLVLGPLNSLFFFTRPRLADALRCRG